MKVLAAVVAAFRQTGAVECRMWPVHFLLCVALHEEIDGHDPGALGKTKVVDHDDDFRARLSDSVRLYSGVL